ncbi:MAG: 7-carboxy-7-deazaguanine synthase QueE [Planctomycetaceae bacterium]|nr:7-carboxy-7-deazaguanine synthase QueE [Planctomycetaceae bacterium]
MWVSEIFQSVQGEGMHVGVPSAFLRTSGCNLRCSFCDTPYTSWEPEGEERSTESLIDELSGFGIEHIVITGGEPTLVAEIVPLTSELAGRGHVITIETAGTVFRPLAAGLISLSPKLKNSIPFGTAWERRHDERRHRPEVSRQWLAGYCCQFKFVVDKPEDIEEVEKYLSEFPEAAAHTVFLMPQGTTIEALHERMEWMTPLAEARGWKVSPRRHIELFGNTRGT